LVGVEFESGSYNKRFIQIIGSIYDKNFPLKENEIEKYIIKFNEQEKFFTRDSNYMKLNLSPFNFPSTETEYWTSEYQMLTGFPTKNKYQDWVWLEREKLFQKMTKEYEPNIIMTFGKSHINQTG